MEIHGKKGYALLKALTEVEDAPYFEIEERASRIYGEVIKVQVLIAELRDKWDLAWEVGSNKYPRWAMPQEVKPAVKDVLANYENLYSSMPHLSTVSARKEFNELLKMEKEFYTYLNNVIKERIEEVIDFGKKISTKFFVEYFQDLFGPVLYFDFLLSIAQQYSICDIDIIDENNRKFSTVGFNLALFGQPGTGKTFATKDLILGNQDQRIPPHGLPGINRYCGGMTPAKFIEIGEAYQGKRFNFIVPEFNDWFKYKGMVEPLKLAMERGIIRYETKSYNVGPYKFSSFFSVNYNTKIKEKGYEVTIKDPNFNAIEDRMLCRLERLTKDIYFELSKSSNNLRSGILQEKMHKYAHNIRDHLTLIYAIQTSHQLTIEKFQPKKVMITNELSKYLDNAEYLILNNLNMENVPFSIRLKNRAIQLAAALSLPNYFNSSSDIIKIDTDATKMATKFFVEEAWIRANQAFSLNEVLKALNL